MEIIRWIRMKRMFLMVLVFFLNLHKGEPCGEKRAVSGTVGGHVTLHVEAVEIEYISWVVSNSVTKLLAKTEPGKATTVRHRAYTGRLRATADGSLIITGLTREDQGQYTANVQRIMSGQCLQTFDLRVFDLLSTESCAEQTNVSGVEGGEVTLPLDLMGSTSITWVNIRNLVHFAVTEPGKPVLVRDDRYKGRLNVTSNGALIITGINTEDQGVYGSYMVTTTSWQCARHYNLTVLGTRRQDGYITHTVTVGKEVKNFTGQEISRTQIQRNCTPSNVISLVISGWVLLMTCCVLAHHIRTEVIMSPTNVQRHRNV